VAEVGQYFSKYRNIENLVSTSMPPLVKVSIISFTLDIPEYLEVTEDAFGVKQTRLGTQGVQRDDFFAGINTVFSEVIILQVGMLYF
jgi:hypothetical protein